MRNFIIDKLTGIVKFETLIPYEISDGEILVETDDLSTLTFGEIIEFIPTEISRAEFIYGLKRENVSKTEVLYFIDNFVTGDLKNKCNALFEDASYFEFNAPLLIHFVPAFNKFLQAQGKNTISLENIFKIGITLNQ